MLEDDAGPRSRQQLEADLALEQGVVDRLRTGIVTMRERGDITSARIFEKILEDEEEHIDYLETELGLIEALGEQLYLQHYIGDAEKECSQFPD